MSTDLAAIFADLQRHHIARPGEALPPASGGVTWIWAANGIFKRGVDAHRDILICVRPTPPTPGLAELRPFVRFRQASGCALPASLLDHLLLHARCMRRVEQQYFITWDGASYQLLIPPQEAGEMRVRYEIDTQAMLVDLHSHHHMPAFWSATDDRDDRGLSISGVIGRLNTDRPEIVIRANVYGHRQRLPLAAIFAGPGLFHEERYAEARA